MNARAANGFSLIEVLVALVVLSIGLLGIAALFVTSLQFGGSAILRTRAVNFAEDLADRIRVNSVAGAAYAAATTDTGTDGECAETADLADAESCTPAELAAHDLFEWKTAIADVGVGLPSGTGEVTVDTTMNPTTYTIVVSWAERDIASSYRLALQVP